MRFTLRSKGSPFRSTRADRVFWWAFVVFGATVNQLSSSACAATPPADPYGALAMVFSREGAAQRAQPLPQGRRVDPWVIADAFIAPSAVPPNLASSFEKTNWSLTTGFVRPLASRPQDQDAPDAREPQAARLEQAAPPETSPEIEKPRAVAGMPHWHPAERRHHAVRASQPASTPAYAPLQPHPAEKHLQRVATKVIPHRDATPKWIPLPQALKPTSSAAF